MTIGIIDASAQLPLDRCVREACDPALPSALAERFLAEDASGMLGLR